MLTLNDGRKELYQWDSGRTATVDIECNVVHFANLKYGESLSVEVKYSEVAIPNQLLMNCEPIYCWAFVKDESGAYTKKEQTLAVIKRAKPSDYVYTETEIINIQTAVENALQEAKESGDFKGEKGDKGDTGENGTSVTVSSVSESTDDGGQNLVTFSDGKTLTVKNGSRGSKGEKGDPTDVRQTTGQSETAVMSQKATTDEIDALKSDLSAEQTARENAINALSVDMTANANADAVTRRSLDALWKLNKGISYDFATDGTEAYEKTVPAGAKYSAVESIGGKTVVWNQLIDKKSFQGTTEKYGVTFTNNGDGTITVNGTATETARYVIMTLETNRKASKYYMSGCPSGGSADTYYIGGKYIWTSDTQIDDGEGAIVNDSGFLSYVDYIGITILAGITVSNLVFKPQLVSLTTLYGEGNEPTSTDDPRIAWIEQYAANHPEYNAGELVSADVESIKNNSYVVGTIPDSVRNLTGYGWSAGSVYNGIERTDNGWQYVQRVGSRDYQDGDVVTDGVTTYYALSEPIITDITDLTAGFPDNFDVEVGGTITFENETKMSVPNTVEYLRSLAEVGS